MFIPPAMLGAYFGARITALPMITDTFQLVCFGVIMAIAIFVLIKR
ncbi:hypothetical protein [Pleurocapsa sp. PCC 7319]|nr:hypothetical protein [Pleurocapsa sp. PCC 7319]